MKVVRDRKEMQESAGLWHREGRAVGFVPTMGALHAGHLSLVEAAREQTHRVAVSLFVNPLQFGEGEDFERYPRAEQADLEALAAAGVDLAFLPSAEGLFPEALETRVLPGATAAELEGAHRPGHFSGVCTIVLKLFGLVRPQRAWFGAKDAQQLAVIRRMVRDLDFPVTIEVGPTIREADGLALSSRNRYLNARQRATARSLHRALRAVRECFEAGERRKEALLALGLSVLDGQDLVLEYLEIRDPTTFRRPPDPLPGGVALLACRVGSTRLIDNVPLGPEAARVLGEAP